MGKNNLNKDNWGEDVVNEEIDNSVAHVRELREGIEEPDVVARQHKDFNKLGSGSRAENDEEGSK